MVAEERAAGEPDRLGHPAPATGHGLQPHATRHALIKEFQCQEYLGEPPLECIEPAGTSIQQSPLHDQHIEEDKKRGRPSHKSYSVDLGKTLRWRLEQVSRFLRRIFDL